MDMNIKVEHLCFKADHVIGLESLVYILKYKDCTKIRQFFLQRKNSNIAKFLRNSENF